MAGVIGGEETHKTPKMTAEQPPLIPVPEEHSVSQSVRVVEFRQVIITPEGERLIIERITDPNDPRIDEIQELLKQQFKPEEVDPKEIMQSAIEGKSYLTGNPIPRYIVTVVQNERGDIVGLATGAVLRLIDKDWHLVGKDSVVFGAYIETAKNFRLRGVAKHAFGFRLLAGESEAQLQGLKVKGYIGEIVDEAELFLNAQGACRLYMHEADGSYKEVPYWQPPIEWDQETGEPAEGAGAVLEHLMVHLPSDEDKLDGSILMSMVRAIYQYDHKWDREAFKNEAAYLKHLRYMSGITERLEDEISGKELVMFTAKEREELKNKGVVFIENVSRDEVLSGYPIEPLSQERMQEAVNLTHSVFPEDALSEDRSPALAFAASLEPEKLKDYSNKFGLGSLEYFVLMDKKADKVVGVTGLYTQKEDPKETVWLGWFCMDPSYRGKGLGEATLRWAVREAEKRGYKTIRLWTTTDPNEAVAQNLYEKLGFKIFAEEEKPGYKILYREHQI